MSMAEVQTKCGGDVLPHTDRSRANVSTSHSPKPSSSLPSILHIHLPHQAFPPICSHIRCVLGPGPTKQMAHEILWKFIHIVTRCQARSPLGYTPIHPRFYDTGTWLPTINASIANDLDNRLADRIACAANLTRRSHPTPGPLCRTGHAVALCQGKVQIPDLHETRHRHAPSSLGRVVYR
jgi:hypothetical protein